jgi:hypothetical protein
VMAHYRGGDNGRLVEPGCQNSLYVG